MSRIAPVIILISLAGVCAAQSVPAPEHYEPLLEAHQNLLLARASIADQDYENALIPLREAGRALAAFQQQDHGPLGEQAAFMRQDIDDYLPHVGRDATVDPIDDWIQKIERWKGNTKHPLQPPPPW